MSYHITFLRFIGHIPCFILASDASSLYNSLRKHPDLIPIPPGSHFRASMHLPAVVTWFIAIYNFLTFPISPAIPPKYSFCFLPFDATFCSLLFTSLLLQAPYIPKVPNACKHSAKTLANGYFEALLQVVLKTWKSTKDSDGNWTKPPTVESTCEDFYFVFAFEITVLVLYGIASTSELLALVLARDSYSSSYSSSRTSYTVPIFSPIKRLFVLIWFLFVKIGSLFSFLVGYCIPSIRFASRYASKNRRTKPEARAGYSSQENDTPSPVPPESKDIELTPLEKPAGFATVIELQPPPPPADKCELCFNSHPKTAFERVLGSDHILSRIATHLHSTDLRHLGQTTSSIRRALYAHHGTYSNPASPSSPFPSPIIPLPHLNPPSPPQDRYLIHTDRPTLLQTSACASAPQSRCWACAIQICPGCTDHAAAPPSRISHHIEHCTLYCHTCYFREICRAQRSLRKNGGRCPHGSPTWGEEDGPGVGEVRALCKPCRRSSGVELAERREKREGWALRLLADQAVRCANCAEGLPGRGPRWWVCELCRLECTDGCHYHA